MLQEQNKNIAIIWPWPGNLSSIGDLEYVCRVTKGFKNIGYNVDIITNDGFILDEQFNRTSSKICEEKLLFILNLHYKTPKKLDAFYYYIGMYPVDFILEKNYFLEAASALQTNDDVLLPGENSLLLPFFNSLMKRDLAAMRLSEIYPSVSEQDRIRPGSQQKRIFYCGANWEKSRKFEQRFEKVFQRLAETNILDIYGPQSAWEGNPCYRGPLPINSSILFQKINESGIVLNLSLPMHYRSQILTNRIYEACCGGAILITERNPFVEKFFGDSVLYVDFDLQNQERVFQQVLAHYEWIQQNPDKAIKKAKQAQKIFLKIFSMEKICSQIIANHSQRLALLKEQSFSSSKEMIEAILILDKINFTELEKEILTNTFANISCQHYKWIRLSIICEEKIRNSVSEFVVTIPDCKKVDYQITSFAFFDEFQNKVKSRCVAFSSCVQKSPSKYCILLEGSEVLFRDHIATLKYALEHSNASYAYSNVLLENTICHIDLIKSNLDLYNVFKIKFPFISSMVLFKKDSWSWGESPFVDGYEIQFLVGKRVCVKRDLGIATNKNTLKIIKKLWLNNKPKTIYPDNIRYNHNFIQNWYKQNNPYFFDISFMNNIKHNMKDRMPVYTTTFGLLKKYLIKFLKIKLFFTLSSKKRKDLKHYISTLQQ